ncbi:GIY-YIG nuclease family protein [Paenisporosarcina indica]|uniref:GIY-YIG nuclease family protein n=1 Tax=Paenisporosarcina indica TaxID=650093 RepID=UPI000A8CE8C5|nr:GIY-YIG nuclease family protein [Paenisporosarcina indica]
MKQQAKEEYPIAGVLLVTNTKNGKVYIEAMNNIKRLNGLLFQLKFGTLLNKDLINDWNSFGEESFTFEVLESFKTEGKSTYQVKSELSQAKEKWLTEKQPYGELGYN